MKYVNAVWDERNFGLKTAEVEIELSDTRESCMPKLIELEKAFEYISVKVPSAKNELTWLMHDLNYAFVEDMMFFEHDLHPIKRTPLQQRLYDAVTISPMEEADFETLFREIDAGSFSFDRISNDPFFCKEASTRRFHNWLNDEKERGAIFLKGQIKGEMTGFFTIRDLGNGVYTSALGGTFMKWRKGGLGTNVQTPDEVRKRGGRKLVLGVSTNNMIQIRALIQNEFFPTKVNHVFVKHVNAAKQEG
ncbi:MAG TPA: hypothetical protein DCR21_03105 [Succinivibrionaceae bacterium]|nr:hypothetical protein [Succinivibrionaceae bacterium]